MKKGYWIEFLFALAYSLLASLAYIWAVVALGLDGSDYPYQKPIMLVVAAAALGVGALLAYLDFNRDCECRLVGRLVVILLTAYATFSFFSQLWGYVLLLIAGL